MMLMALGLFVFSIPTLAHDELSRKASYRHVSTPRMGARDATQFTGVGDETVSISGSAFTEMSDAEASIAQLRAMAEPGAAWSLVDGTGTVWGSFVILTVDEKRRALWPNGKPRQIDFALELLRVDDGTGIGRAA
jgi:phage protein U